MFGYGCGVTGRNLSLALVCWSLLVGCDSDGPVADKPPQPAEALAVKKNVPTPDTKIPPMLASPVKPVATALKLELQGKPRPGQPLSFRIQPVDAKGQAVELPLDNLNLHSFPESERTGPQKLKFAAEGRYSVTAELQPATGAPLLGSLEVVVDQTAPALEIVQPPAGSMLSLANPLTVEVRATDKIAGIDQVTVDGKPVTLDDQGRGSVRVTPKFGLNVFHVQATDRAGNQRKGLRGVYAATGYQPTTGRGQATTIEHGLQAFLGQAALDAGARSHRNPRDLATVMELVLGGFQGSAIAGQSFPVNRHGFNGSVTLTDFRHGQASRNHGYPEIKLEAVRGGLDMRATLRNMRVQAKISGKMLLSKIGMRATITAESASIGAKISVVMLANQKVLVKTQNVKIELHGLDIEVSGNLSSVLNPVLDAFKQRITNTLEERLAKRLATAFDRPLAGALQQLAVNREFVVPGVYGSWPTKLQLHSSLEQLLIDRGESGRKPGIEVALRAGVTGPSRLGRTIPGSPMRGDCRTTTAKPNRLVGKQPFEVGLSLDLANQVLTSVWQGGGFRQVGLEIGDVELAGGLYRLKNLKVGVDLGLPPLLSDCGPSGKLQLQAGEIRGAIKTELGGEQLEVDVVLHVAAHGAATARVNPKSGVRELGLSLDPAHVLDFEVVGVRVAGKPAPPERAAFVESALGLISGRLLEMFQGTLASVPMPELPLQSLSPAVPRGASLKLDIRNVGPAAGEIRAAGVVR